MIDQDQSMVDEHLGSHETGILPDLSSATPVRPAFSCDGER